MFVAEADESDGSFLRYRPTVAVVTNVEPDHLDHYGTEDAVREAFEAFTDRIVPGGVLIACADDPGSLRLAERLRRTGAVEVLTYGEAAGADVRMGPIRTDGGGLAVRLAAQRWDAVEVRLPLPGAHNAANAAAAWTVGAWLGLDGECLAEGLARYGGTRRRFELRGEVGGVAVRDDYAHHPTEVEALLRAARGATSGRVLIVFQPHLFSRTRIFADQFARALALADEVVVLDVYPAREEPEPGVTGELISSAVPLPAERVVYAPHEQDAVTELVDRARAGDLVLTVGAGDVTRLGPQVLAGLADRLGLGARPADDAGGSR